jgi:hypothetical protein
VVILQQPTSKHQTHLIRGYIFSGLNLGLETLDGIRGIDVQGNGLASHGLDKDLVQMPMIQAAMEAFDAIIVKVEQPSARLVHDNPPNDMAQA